MKRILSAFRRSFTLRAAVGFAAAAMFLAVAGFFLRSDSFQGPDLALREYIQTLESSRLTAVMLVITRLGSTVVLTVVGLAVVLVFAYFRWWRPIGLLLLAMAGQAVLHLGFKALFNIDRPEALLNYIIGDTNSFPSGHAVASTSFYGLIAALTSRRVRSRSYMILAWTVAAILVFLICFSRVYFGVHHPSDVVTGFVAGLVWFSSVATGDRNP